MTVYDQITHEPLWRKIHELVSTEPEKLDMSDWGLFVQDGEALTSFEMDSIRSKDHIAEQTLEAEDCTTALCIAGHAAMLTGMHPTVDVTSVSWGQVNSEPGQSWNAPTTKTCSNHAMDVLGLSEKEADWLFFESNKFGAEVLRRVAEGSTPAEAMEATYDHR